jgi:hypothetical protein
MAIQPDPDTVLCANLWRHGTNHQLPAVAYVSDATNPLGPQGTPRCRSCVNSLTSANRAAVRVHVTPINPDHDLDPATEDDPDVGGVPI